MQPMTKRQADAINATNPNNPTIKTKQQNFYIPCYNSPIPSEYTDIKIVMVDDIYGEIENYKTTFLTTTCYTGS